MSTPPPAPEPREWPWYVRVLAVLHALSPMLGFLGFLGLCLAGGVAYGQRGEFDVHVVSLFAAALACPLCGASYRRWFENWGRKRWPDGD